VQVERRGIPNFAGVKDTGLYETRAFPDFMRAAAFQGGKYEVLCGREELSVEASAIGAAGFSSSLTTAASTPRYIVIISPSS